MREGKFGIFRWHIKDTETALGPGKITIKMSYPVWKSIGLRSKVDYIYLMDDYENALSPQPITALLMACT